MCLSFCINHCCAEYLPAIEFSLSHYSWWRSYHVAPARNNDNDEQVLIAAYNVIRWFAVGGNTSLGSAATIAAIYALLDQIGLGGEGAFPG